MKYFSIEELCKSETAKSKNINNSPSEEIKTHLKELVENLLDPLREAWGSPIHVNSGYRCEKLNKAIGGAKNSAHKYGYAADIVPANGKIYEFKLFVRKWLKENYIKFDQYIDEQKGNSHWVHLGYKHNGVQRMQYLIYKGGKYSTIK